MCLDRGHVADAVSWLAAPVPQGRRTVWLVEEAKSDAGGATADKRLLFNWQCSMGGCAGAACGAVAVQTLGCPLVQPLLVRVSGRPEQP